MNKYFKVFFLVFAGFLFFYLNHLSRNKPAQNTTSPIESSGDALGFTKQSLALMAEKLKVEGHRNEIQKACKQKNMNEKDCQTTLQLSQECKRGLGQKATPVTESCRVFLTQAQKMVKKYGLGTLLTDKRKTQKLIEEKFKYNKNSQLIRNACAERILTEKTCERVYYFIKNCEQETSKGKSARAGNFCDQFYELSDFIIEKNQLKEGPY